MNRWVCAYSCDGLDRASFCTVSWSWILEQTPLSLSSLLFLFLSLPRKMCQYLNEEIHVHVVIIILFWCILMFTFSIWIVIFYPKNCVRCVPYISQLALARTVTNYSFNHFLKRLNNRLSKIRNSYRKLAICNFPWKSDLNLGMDLLHWEIHKCFFVLWSSVQGEQNKPIS